MLLELRVKNIAVIESVTLSFTQGLNVLTGETGAGKSIIAGALGLLLGERADTELIRTGSDKAVSEATFDISSDSATKRWLDETGIDNDSDLLVLRRELSISARSRAWINGTSVTIAQLRDIGTRLVVVHGQHDSWHLTDSGNQRTILDEWAGAGELAKKVAKAHDDYINAINNLNVLEDRTRKLSQRRDYLAYVLEEIEKVSPSDREEEELESEFSRLANAKELGSLASRTAQLIYDDESSVLNTLSAVRRLLNGMERLDSHIQPILSSLESAILILDDLARDITNYQENINSDPARLAAVEARRHDLFHLLKKYGPSISDVHTTATTFSKEIKEIDESDLSREKAELEVEKTRSSFFQLSNLLSASREKAAPDLAESVSKILPLLGLPSAKFIVQIEKLEVPISHGAEQIVFHVSPNPGLASAPLSRIASGGELARIMLALSSVAAQAQSVPTLVFDEIDAGIGGEAAWKAGALMRELSSKYQILSISHLAQIASCAHNHLVVSKKTSSDSDGDSTITDIRSVDGESRVEEISRMLGGDSDRQISRDHAREMLNRGLALVSANQKSTKSQRRGNRG